MILVFVVAAALWGFGLLMGASRQARLVMVGALFALVLVVHLVLPAEHGLVRLTGGSLRGWLILGGLAALVAIYVLGLGRLRDRASDDSAPEARERHVPEPPKASGDFQPGELDRYLRHIVLRELGGPGQKKLKQARVLVIGAGGLGSPALLYLAAAGVGTIGVIDDDVVDASNMQRQVAHSDDRIGMAKVFSAQAAMQAVNPFVVVRPYQRRLAAEMVDDLLGDYDLVLDGTDNFETRYMVNAACVKAGKPLISGALSQWEGQLSVFDAAAGGPCYQCIFPEAPAAGLAPSCAEAGVLGPLPGVVGSMMAVECVKVITGAGQALRGEMLIYDALWGETRKIGLKRRADCPCCGG